MDLQGVANRIKDLRRQINLSQLELAERLKVHQTKISQTELGKTKPSFEVLFYLSDCCGVSIDYILKGGDPTLNPSCDIKMKTASGKEALSHLKKCAKSIKKLDEEAYPPIKELEDETTELEDPEITLLTRKLEPQLLEIAI